MILPSPPAAVGVFEAAALIALAAYGIPHYSALSYAVVLHLVNFVPYIVVGVLRLATTPVTQRLGSPTRNKTLSSYACL